MERSRQYFKELLEGPDILTLHDERRPDERRNIEVLVEK